VKWKHFSALLVYFAKILRETGEDKYNKFKGVVLSDKSEDEGAGPL